MAQKEMPYAKPKQRLRTFLHPLAVVVVLVVTLLAACGGESGSVVTVQVTSAAPAEGVHISILPEQGEGEVLQGQTPWRVSLAPGGYRYIATAPGYQSTNGSINVPQGEPTVSVEIPPLSPATGMVLVRSNALVEVAIDSVVQEQPAGPDSAIWVSYGPFAVGPHVVRAVSALGVQEKSVDVAEQHEVKVEFFWGGQLRVVVQPTGIPSVTVTVDGQPYTGPVDFTAERLSSRAFADVVVAAPGYETWADNVFLQPGDVVTVSAVLQMATVTTTTSTISPTATAEVEEEILASYWHFWQVWDEAGQTFDAARLAEVMTGVFLDNQQAGFEAIRSQGTMRSWSIDPAAHTPTVSNLAASSVDVQVVCDVTQTIVLQDGSIVVQLDQLEGVFGMQLGADGVWRVASWTGNWQAKAEPTPTPVAGGGGGQGTAPPDRAQIVQILLANVNCLRADHGLPPVEFDWSMAGAVQPIADAATAYAASRGWLGGLPDNQSEISAAVEEYGGFYIAEVGTALSLVPGNALEGTFAFDWENYDGDPYPPCAADWGRGNPEPWLRPEMTHVAIVLGPAVWEGFYLTVLIAVGR